MKVLDPDQTIVAIGSYGYDWAQGQNAEAVTFQDSDGPRRRRPGRRSRFDPDTQNPHFSYAEDDGTHAPGVVPRRRHRLQPGPCRRRLQALRLCGMAAGLGRPLDLVDARPPLRRRRHRTHCATIGQGEDIDIEGQGEILQIASRARRRARARSSVDKDDGGIDDETYTALPSSYVIQRVGTAAAQDRADLRRRPRSRLDAADPRHPQGRSTCRPRSSSSARTPRSSPRLVQREVAEGHDVGNHTFTHPNLGETSPGITALELNATQRLFEALTGRSMRLFRAPYFGDAEPTTADELVPIEERAGDGLHRGRPAHRPG